MKDLLLNAFRQGMEYEKDWNNYQIGEVEEITELDFIDWYKTIDTKWLTFLIPLIDEYRDGVEPLDGDEVDRLCEIIKDKINLHEGNITEQEYNNILK